MKELPDWGKLIFKPSPGKGWEQLLPGVPPAALDLVRGLMQYNPGGQGWAGVGRYEG